MNKLKKLSSLILSIGIISSMNMSVSANTIGDSEKFAFNDVTITMLGDCNNDGNVNILDLLTLKRYNLGLLDTIQNADLNQDNNINSMDLLLLKRTILGLDNVIKVDKGYRFDENGTLYLDGQLYSGTYTNDNGISYLYQDGSLYNGLIFNDDNTINGYTDGLIVSGWVTFQDETYYFNDSNNQAVKGVVSIDGSNYYFNRTNAKLMKNCVIGEWVINGNGVATSELKSKAKNVLSTYGSTPNAIYNNYMRVYHRYQAISDSVSLSFSATNDTVTPQIVSYSPAISSVNATGWSCFALYTIDKGNASCYYLASLQDYLFRQAGYTSRIVYGTQGSGVHYWNQVLVDGVWLNYDGCNNGRGGKTDSQLLAIKSTYQWCGYLVPDKDYNGCYYYKTTSDYNNGNYTYIVNDIYHS